MMRTLPPRMQDTLYYDMILPKETLEIMQKTREFAVKEVAPSAQTIGQQEETKENFGTSSGKCCYLIKHALQVIIFKLL